MANYKKQFFRYGCLDYCLSKQFDKLVILISCILLCYTKATQNITSKKSSVQ